MRKLEDYPIEAIALAYALQSCRPNYVELGRKLMGVEDLRERCVTMIDPPHAATLEGEIDKLEKELIDGPSGVLSITLSKARVWYIVREMRLLRALTDRLLERTVPYATIYHDPDREGVHLPPSEGGSDGEIHGDQSQGEGTRRAGGLFLPRGAGDVPGNDEA